MLLVDALIALKWAKTYEAAISLIEKRLVMKNAGWCDKWTGAAWGDRICLVPINETVVVRDGYFEKEDYE